MWKKCDGFCAFRTSWDQNEICEMEQGVGDGWRKLISRLKVSFFVVVK